MQSRQPRKKPAFLRIGLATVIVFVAAWALLMAFPQGTSKEVDSDGWPTNGPCTSRVRVRSGEKGSADVGNIACSAAAPVSAGGAARYSRRLRIQFDDEWGAPVGRWPFRYAMLDHQRRQDLVLRKDDVVDNHARCPKSAESSPDGSIDLVAEWDSPRTEITTIIFQPISKQWRFIGSGNAQLALLPHEFGIDMTRCGDVAVIRLRKSDEFTFVITYSDRAPFVGEVAFKASMQNGAHRFSEKVRTDDDGCVSVSAMRSDVQELLLSFTSERRGFRSANQLLFDVATLSVCTFVVIPPDERQSCIIVNLQQWPVNEAVDIKVMTVDGIGVMTGVGNGGGRWQTVKPRGNGWGYRIEVTGASGIWRSGLFQLAEGETKELAAAPTIGFRVRAKVVDVAGQPIKLAAMHTLYPGGPNWHSMRNVQAVAGEGNGSADLAFSGATGVVVLSGLTPGDVRLTVEAPGLEIVERVVTGTSGEDIDLGDVVLTQATGRILVYLTGRRPGLKYYVWLNSAVGSGVLAVEKGVVQDQVLFERVARREYRIHVAAGNGGRGANIHVNLKDVNTAEIFIDVSGLQAPTAR